MPKWARLLDQHQAEGHTGLTLSFLAGALREPPGAVLGAEISLAAFRALLEAMTDEPAADGRVVRIFECHNLMQPVAALSYPEYFGVAVVGAKGSSRLYAWPQYLVPDPSFESLVSTLWSHFREPICSGRFSYQRAAHAFQSFDESDMQFIQRALASGDDD